MLYHDADQSRMDMSPISRKLLVSPALVVLLMVMSDPAHALRCGSKLVLEGMLEQEVIEHCGEPTSVRHLGYVVRSFHPLSRRNLSGTEIYRYGHDYYQEVPVTVFIYNFGPRKLMRRLRFEGGVLTEVETLGHGYLEKDK
jgi:hypothetical protein